MDAELCGPTFTPDGATLFLSVQHPGERSKSLAEVSTRRPDFKNDMPPRPAIVVITNAQGSEIGV
jgi:secreted PhoX family phosphatase